MVGVWTLSLWTDAKGIVSDAFFFLMREGVNMYLWLSWKSLWTPGWPWIERDPPVPPCLVSMHFWRYRKPRGSAVSQAAWAVLSEQTDQVRQSPRFNIRTSRQGKRNAWTDFVFSSKRKKGKQHLTIKWRVFFMSCISYCTEKKNLPKRNKKKTEQWVWVHGSMVQSLSSMWDALVLIPSTSNKWINSINR